MPNVLKIMMLTDLAIFISIIAGAARFHPADFAEIQKQIIWASLRYVLSLLVCPKKKLMLFVLLASAYVQAARFLLSTKVDVTTWSAKIQFVRIIGAGDATSFC